MTGVNGGFMNIRRFKNLPSPDYVIFIIGFLLGMLIVLNRQFMSNRDDRRHYEQVNWRRITHALAIGNGIAIVFR